MLRGIQNSLSGGSLVACGEGNKTVEDWLHRFELLRKENDLVFFIDIGGRGPREK